MAGAALHSDNFITLRRYGLRWLNSVDIDGYNDQRIADANAGHRYEPTAYA